MAALQSSPSGAGATYAYSAYGLDLRSVVPLPATVRHDGRVDAEVRRAHLQEITARLAAAGVQMHVRPAETHLLLPGIGTFLVRDGREILIDASREADDSLLQLAIMGPVLAALLQQRGCLILHASAVEMDGAAVGFLGGRGAGKSTMAAALHAQGYPLLADDMLAIRVQDTAPLVVPGFPQLKLWPDALVALGGDPDVLPRVRASYGKRTQRIPERSGGRAGLALACLYVLCHGAEFGIESLSPRDAFLHIVAHSYGIEWLHDVSGASQFKERADLVECIPVRRLQRPPDLEMVPHLIRLVEADLVSC